MRSRRNTAILGALVVLIILFEAFQAGEPSNGADSPVDVSNQYRGTAASVLAIIDGPMELFGCVKYCWPADKNRSAVVIYEIPNQSSQDSGSIGWDLVGEYGGKWYSLPGGGTGNGDTSGAPQLISLTSMTVPASTITYRYGVRPGYVMTIGRTASPEVMQIAVRYDTGEVVAQRPTNGAFAVFARARAACQVQLFGDKGTLLQTLDPSNDMQLAMEIDQYAPGSCGS